MELKIPTKADWEKEAGKLRLKDGEIESHLADYERIPEEDFENRLKAQTSLRELAGRAARQQKNPKAAQLLANLEKAADFERGKTSRAQKAEPDETISPKEAEARIKKIKFSGLLLNRPLAEVEDQTIINALRGLRECPNKWREGAGTHFIKRLKERGPGLGIPTAAHLNRAIQAGHSKQEDAGKWVHHIGKAKIVYNPVTWVLISFGY